MNNLISTIEIAFFIMLPLVIFYRQTRWQAKYYILSIGILYSIWYLSYMLLHELTHWLGASIVGKEVTNYQLIPHFWKGNFGTGFIEYDFRGDRRDFFIIILPYVRDIIFLLVGYILLKRELIKNLFLAGLIFVMLILSPLYDISNNYIAYLLGALNDFNALSISSSRLITNTIGVLSMAVALVITYKSIRLNIGVVISNYQTKV